MTETALIKTLELWDGKRVQDLKDLYRSLGAAQWSQLIRLLETRTDLQTATTWLFKHHYDQGHQFDQKSADRIVAVLEDCNDWESILHILQVIPKIDVSASLGERIRPTVESHLSSKRPFIRATAYEAYYKLIKNNPTLLHEFLELCQLSMEEESASVKVKIRRILKQH